MLGKLEASSPEPQTDGGSGTNPRQPQDLLKLNLGCGRKPLPRDHGWLNVDEIPGPGVDLVLNLEHLPWPFGDDTVDAIFTCDLVEHLARPEEALLECHRVLRPGGVLEVIAPHHRNPQAYSLGHRSYYNEESLRLLWIRHRATPSGDVEPLFNLQRLQTRYTILTSSFLSHALQSRWPWLTQLPLGQPNEIQWTLVKRYLRQEIHHVGGEGLLDGPASAGDPHSSQAP